MPREHSPRTQPAHQRLSVYHIAISDEEETQRDGSGPTCLEEDLDTLERRDGGLGDAARDPSGDELPHGERQPGARAAAGLSGLPRPRVHASPPPVPHSSAAASRARRGGRRARGRKRSEFGGRGEQKKPPRHGGERRGRGIVVVCFRGLRGPHVSVRGGPGWRRDGRKRGEAGGQLVSRGGIVRLRTGAEVAVGWREAADAARTALESSDFS